MNTKLLILKTNILSKRKLQLLAPAFNEHRSIQRWTVDLEDIDKVLRIEGDSRIDQSEIIELVKNNGFYAEDLEG